MKIYLYLKENILTFTIPQRISGTFNFAENPEEETKLINITAKEEAWYLYSTTDVSVLKNDAPIDELLLESDNYYTLQRGDQKFLIYVTHTFDKTFLPYRYDSNLNLVIGNNDLCNVKFDCPYIDQDALRISCQDNILYVTTNKNYIYLNNIVLESNNEIINYQVKSGDVLNVYGFKAVFFNGFMLINNPHNKVVIGNNTGLLSYHLTYGSEPLDLPIKEQDLYNKEQYFSKSPRVRRQIITKEIKFSPPPHQNGEDSMPLILTIGPMLTMGVISLVMIVNTVSKIGSGETTMAKSWPSLVTASAMLISIIVWPTLTKLFNKKLKARSKKELYEKYNKYLGEKEQELKAEQLLQKNILIENLIPVNECLNIIKNGNINFWDKRIEQNDFLDVRVGRGDELLDCKINYPEEGFSVDESDLKVQADNLVAKYKYVHDVPIKYSLFNSRITALMGDLRKCYGMVNNIILQLITFYSYEDIKLVIITNKFKEKDWDYIKYLNHNFSNNKAIRFFSTDVDEAKIIEDYLSMEFQNRLQLSKNGKNLFKPYYIIITDDYSQIKRHNFTKILTELDINLGFSLLIIEKRMSNLPSKCNNFINLGTPTSGILRNSFEAQEQVQFRDEIDYTINMMDIARKLSNIPIEFEEGNKELPESISFLEMEKVGKVEQLNIINRWDTNDSTTSLKAEVGVDEEGRLMYLDLHEKYHGPHGLIAGMTGSGKSEFIITYILSMAINYSPDDVAFILIDYKGGGLAFAFENKMTGVSLPHLAGTITNLDKAEMNRTLVSIDSEIKRRQRIFNIARDRLGESTIDIYKYQRYYKDGRLEEAIPHLFIVCDEFAELKSQQPDFMDNLISVARIGRSLGIHLILATQKPSGVVNDQIWSNTKFRVCLKVQDASDSREMLKRPDAASLKQTGRFYLQVGYDEYFALGQSAWCGAKYYPSEKIVKNPDKSVNFIDDTGNIIKSIQSGNSIQLKAHGEQLAAIMENIIEVAKTTNKKAKRLWLSNIDAIILGDYLEKKYSYEASNEKIEAIIGEYDAPEKQEQGLLTYNIDMGNTLIYGNDDVEKENLLIAMIYYLCKYYISKDLNIYAIDFGSEQLRVFNDFPQVGGIVFSDNDEELKNLFKMINEEIKSRKKLLINYGGSLSSYNSKNDKKLPYIIFIINNYDSLLESYNNIYEDINSISRECERYGIILIITVSNVAALPRRISQSFNNRYAFHLADSSDYMSVFNKRVKVKPRDILGRGLAFVSGDIHEFQTLSLVDEDSKKVAYVEELKTKIKIFDPNKARLIPSLPDEVTYDLVEKEITDLTCVPIGISKNSLKIIKHDFLNLSVTPIISNKLDNINCFIDSLVDILLRINGTAIFFVDAANILNELKDKNYNNKKIYYFANNFENVISELFKVDSNPSNNKFKLIYILYGLEKLKNKVNTKSLEEFLNHVRTNENSILILCDSMKGIKSIEYESWYTKIKNNSDGIWIGKGFGEQQVFRISKLTKEMQNKYPNNYGFWVNENNADLIKLLEFNKGLLGEEQDEE